MDVMKNMEEVTKKDNKDAVEVINKIVAHIPMYLLTIFNKIM